MVGSTAAFRRGGEGQLRAVYDAAPLRYTAIGIAQVRASRGICCIGM